jgi:hypothetical protein
MSFLPLHTDDNLECLKIIIKLKKMDRKKEG